jgi:hypothetical protein
MLSIERNRACEQYPVADKPYATNEIERIVGWTLSHLQSAKGAGFA